MKTLSVTLKFITYLQKYLYTFLITKLMIDIFIPSLFLSNLKYKYFQ